MEPSCLDSCGACCDTWCPHYQISCSKAKPNGSYPTYKVGRAMMTSATPLNLGYHNYGLEFLSDRIIFYFDYQPYSWIINGDCQSPSVDQLMHALDISAHPMTIIFDNSKSKMKAVVA